MSTQDVLTLCGRGKIAQRGKNFRESERLYREAIQVEESLGNKQSAACIYRQMAELEFEKRNLDRSEEWCLLAMTANREMDDTSELAANYILLGRIAFLGDQNVEKAERCFHEALKIDEARLA